MSARPGSILLFTVSCVVAGAVAIGAAGCEQGSEPPPETPKSAAKRPPDVTEVTMEVSSASPPGEHAASPPGETASVTAADASAPAASGNAPDPSDDPNIGGVQSDPVVEKALAPVRPRLRACYKKALAAEPHVAGSATFDATIGKEGKVASARFVKRDGLNEDMVGCLLVAVKAMTFDPNKKSQIVTMTFGSPAPRSGDAGK